MPMKNNNKAVRIYKHKGKVIAIVVKGSYKTKGMHFFTSEEFSQQLAYVYHEKDRVVVPHIHKRYKRVLYNTQETDIIKKGKARFTLYTSEGKLFKTMILGAGDMILFASGGHGYKVIEDIELITVKQGPYAAGGRDKKYMKYII
ncbi:MAG: hypothetical protein WC955_09025 [Elusimicrobiota bacterium]